MENLSAAKQAILELQIENVGLNKKLSLTKFIMIPLILVLVLCGIFVKPEFYLFSVVLFTVFVFNIRYLNIEIKMNNFVILVTHSCIQGELNKDFDPSKDSSIVNKELIG